MYRILEEHGEVRERRNQRRHPNYTKPELLAEAPNQVWSWDITKLRGPVKWTYYYLYVILDIFSRYVVGWMLAHRESAALAQRLIAESCRKQDIEPDQLTLHADRGSSMRSKPVGLLLADLGVTKTHSRPYVSNDNPYSESQFQDDEVLSSVSEPLWFRRRRPAILLRFLRLLQFSPPALGNRPYDTGRRSLWSSRTAHHRSAPDPSRSSTGSSRTLRSRNAATARFASAGLDQPAAGKNDPPRCRTSPSRGGVHTWGTSFFCFTQRPHESPHHNRGSLNAARECPKVVDMFRLGRLNMENADLKSQLKERDARIAKLESVLEESRRAGKRQAAPFSKDKPKRDPKKPGRKPGSKYGLQAVRAIPVPDKTFEAPCPEQCPCGGKVGAEGSIDLYQVDIPPIQPETWKFVVGHGHCQECGRRVRGQHPLLISKAFEVGTVHFGPRLLAFAAFQKMICGVSYDKIRLGFEQMLGFPVARSTLCRAMQRLARCAKPTRDALVEALRASPVVYADETGWKQGGRRVWLWVFTNLRETVYEILPGRGFEQAASVLGKNYAGTLGVDGWAPYRCFKEATLQTCYNHLLHRCHELLETATRGAVRFPRLVKAILRHALALRDRRDAGEISPHGLRVAKGLLQAKMNRLLHGRFTNPANQRFAKHLRRYRDNLFVFLDRADVEATNYPVEQDIRIAVVNRKTCGGGNRTAKGAQAQSILMSVLQSCRHKGIRVIDIVTSILRAPDNTPVPLVNPER